MNKDNIERASTNRRGFLRGAAAVGVGATLAPYLGKAGIVGATTVPPGGDGTAAAGVDAVNPFGIAENSTVDAVIFDGGYGVDYVEFAADIFAQTHEGSTVEVSPVDADRDRSCSLASSAANPPDLVDNSGAQAIGFNTILDQLEDLTDVIDAPNLEGVPIRDTLYGGVLSPGTFGGKLAAINYAFTVYGVWYSGSLFEENGWTPPTNWAEALELGAAAQRAGQVPVLLGPGGGDLLPDDVPSSRRSRKAATRYAWRWEPGGGLLVASRPVQAAFSALKEIIDDGYMQPGGGGTQFTQAQAQWSLDQDAIMYPSGSWIENEMKDQTAENFQMRGVPTWAVTADSAMPATALRARRVSRSSCRRRAPTSPAARSCCGSCCRPRRRRNFAQTKLAPTIVAGLVPEDGFGSTALVSQAEMLAAAGEDIFNFVFVDFYGTNQDQLPIWNSFLAGDSSVEDLTNAAAGHHRPDPRGRLDHQDLGGVTSSAARRRQRHRRLSPRRGRSPRGGAVAAGAS